MFCVAHVFVHTFVKLILPQVSVESIDLLYIADLFFDECSILILAQASIELFDMVGVAHVFNHSFA